MPCIPPASNEAHFKRIKIKKRRAGALKLTRSIKMKQSSIFKRTLNSYDLVAKLRLIQ